MNFLAKTWKRLRNPEYRKAFAASQLNIGIPFQIRALMQQRGWTQADLAHLTGIRQPTISSLTRPGKVEPNIKTLRRLAEAFDCALMVRFVPFSELVQSADRFSPDTFTAVPFAQDSIEEDPPARLALEGEAAPLLERTNGDTTAASNSDKKRKPVENERMTPQPVIDDMVSVTMSWEHAKALIEVLVRRVQKYEEAHGKLRTQPKA